MSCFYESTCKWAQTGPEVVERLSRNNIGHIYIYIDSAWIRYCECKEKHPFSIWGNIKKEEVVGGGKKKIEDVDIRTRVDKQMAKIKRDNAKEKWSTFECCGWIIIEKIAGLRKQDGDGQKDEHEIKRIITNGKRGGGKK